MKLHKKIDKSFVHQYRYLQSQTHNYVINGITFVIHFRDDFVMGL